MPLKSQDTVIKRWFKEGKPLFKDFAPYAFFCIRANFLWALGMVNTGLFQPDKNDRKDLEYCYYLPHCEIFASSDRKHKRLVPFLLRPDQSFVAGDELKEDLRQLSEKWEALSREERIQYHSERGNTPPEDENSIVFQLWKKHRNKISKPIPLEMLKVKIVDSSLPEEEQVPITFEEFLNSTIKEMKTSTPLSSSDLSNLKEDDPRVFLYKSSRVSKKRLLKMYPHLTESDLEKSDSD